MPANNNELWSTILHPSVVPVHSDIHKTPCASINNTTTTRSNSSHSFNNCCMNRKSKNSDIWAQLGEPLPLPYKPKLQAKADESTDTIVKHEPVRLASEPPIRRRLFSGYNELRVSEPEVPPSPPRLPLWRRNVSVGSSALVPTLNTIEQKIQELRSSCGNEAVDKKIEAKLRAIEQDLDTLIEELKEASIMEELERLQHLRPAERNSHDQSTKLAAGAAVLLAFGAVSFWLGHMSYEYCYYWC